MIWTHLLAFAAPPSAGALTTEVEPLALLNPDLSQDSGEGLGQGDKIADNGIPDGWRGRIRSGTVTLTARERGTEVAYSADANATWGSVRVPASSGQSFQLTTALNTDGAHKATLGIAYAGENGLISWDPRTIATESPGWHDVTVRGMAPEGTTEVFVRLLLAAQDGADSFLVDPIVLERVTAASRSTRFDLPRVILFTIETFRWDHASMHGYDRATTPNLARLAAEGAVFTQHRVQAPFTRPSLSSLVTSRFPSSVGVMDNTAVLPMSADTVAERFAGSGYVTGAFLAQYILGQEFNFNQGFHAFHHYQNDTTADRVGQDLMPWLQAHADDNQFVWVHLFDPHGPYRPPEPWASTFEGDATWAADTQKLEPGTGNERGPVIPDYVYDAGQDERRHYVARYDAGIAYADAKLGELIDWLEATGQASDTLVIVSADHGESMTDHGRYFAHGSLYEHDLHVPLVVWAPGRVPAGTVVDERSDHLDLVPTMLDYAGLAQPHELKGHSLRGRIEGGTAPEPYSVAMEGKRAAVVSDDLKVIVEDGVAVAAYDLAADPDEAENVLAQRSDDVEALVKGYERWIAERLKDDAPAPAAPVERAMSEEEIEMLRSLGYIE